MDVFSIKSVDAVFKIGDREYPFVDPPFLKKVTVRKKMLDLYAKYEKDEIDAIEYSKKVFACNKDNIKLYLPDLPDADLDALGESALTALLRHLTKLTEEQFGAVVEKVEAK